ncbi:MAG: hypothetical protein GY723_05635 [bacterium]|nr:hypothetical protein [bacterium]MCP5069528.1 hypothetical protein [bacterium]
MRWVAAVGGGAFVLASLAVGFRLLLLAARTRAVPETTLGLGLGLMGGFAYPLTSVARQAEALTDEIRTWLMIAAHVLMVVGIGCIAIFTWQVFRPESRAARSGVAGIVAALIGCFVWQGISPGYMAGALAKEGMAIVGINALAAVAMGWTAIESLHFATQLRRRIPLGLAEPRVARQVALWGTAASAATLITFVTLTLHFMGMDPSTSTVGALAIGPLGLIAAISLSRAFGILRPARATPAYTAD